MSSSQNSFPVFQIVAGTSLDGRIADASGAFEEYSSEQDKTFLKQKIQESDALLMGRKTFEKHVDAVSKPHIIFTRQVKGLEIDKKDGQIIHWFNDSAEELYNLCRLLRYQKVTVLGGAEIYHWALENKVATDLYITREPMLFGKGKHLLEGGVLTEIKNWKLQSQKILNPSGSILLHYRYP